MCSLYEAQEALWLDYHRSLTILNAVPLNLQAFGLVVVYSHELQERSWRFWCKNCELKGIQKDLRMIDNASIRSLYANDHI